MKVQEAEQHIDRALAELIEHFDAVQILVTWPNEQGGTNLTMRGRGDWYARKGMAHAFIEDGVAQDTSDQIARKLNPPDTPESWNK